MDNEISPDILNYEIMSYLNLSTAERLGMTSSGTSQQTLKMRQRMKLQDQINRNRSSLRINEYLVEGDVYDADGWLTMNQISVRMFPQPKLPYGIPDLDHDNNKILENIESNDLWSILAKLMRSPINYRNSKILFNQIKPYVPELFKYNLLKDCDELFLTMIVKLYPQDEFMSLLERYQLAYEEFKIIYLQLSDKFIEEYVDGDKFSPIILSSILDQGLVSSDPEIVDFMGNYNSIPLEYPPIDKIFDKLADYIEKCDPLELPKFYVYGAFARHMSRKFAIALSRHEDYYRPHLIMWYYFRNGIRENPDFFHDEYLKAVDVMPDIGERLYASSDELKGQLIKFFIKYDIIPRDIQVDMIQTLDEEREEMMIELENEDSIIRQIEIINKYSKLFAKPEETYDEYTLWGIDLAYQHIGIEAKKYLLNLMVDNGFQIDSIRF